MTDIIENQLGEQEPGEVREKTGLALDPATLSGDIAESLVGWYKCQPKPWNAMSYDDQKGMIDAIESLAERIVCKAVSLIAKNGRTTIQATLDQVTIKDGIKAVLTMSKHDPHRHELADSQGKAVLIVVADAQEFIGSQGDINPDAPKGGQPELPLDQHGEGFGEDRPVFDQTDSGRE